MYISLFLIQMKDIGATNDVQFAVAKVILHRLKVQSSDRHLLLIVADLVRDIHNKARVYLQ